MKNKYNVCYATDDNYLMHLCSSIVSLLTFSKNPQEVTIHILANNVSISNKKILIDISKEYDSTIIFYDVNDLTKYIPLTLEVNKLSISTYLRLFLAEILPRSIEKILYLDCDVIINGNVWDIWENNIDDYLVGGVVDTMFPKYLIEIGLKQDEPYINAGVLFINLRKWKENNITQQFVDFINKFNGSVPHLDQGVINGVIKKKFILNLCYNVQSPVFVFKRYHDLINFYGIKNYYKKEVWLFAKNNPIIIHYTSSYVGRPWYNFCLHPLKNKYLHFRRLTVFKDTLLFKSNFSFFERVKNYLMLKSQSLFLTIRKVYEKNSCFCI